MGRQDHWEVIGAEVAAEVPGPCVWWVIDGTPAAVRTAARLSRWATRLKFVDPAVVQRLERRGPSVALLADDSEAAGAVLGPLLPVPVVPVWFGGAHLAGRVRVRFGRPVAPRPKLADTLAAVELAAQALRTEESAGWWQATQQAQQPAPGLAPATQGWRLRWGQSAPRPSVRSIWS